MLLQAVDLAFTIEISLRRPSCLPSWKSYRPDWLLWPSECENIGFSIRCLCSLLPGLGLQTMMATLDNGRIDFSERGDTMYVPALTMLGLYCTWYYSCVQGVNCT